MKSDLQRHKTEFATLTDALDCAAQGNASINFHSLRGKLTQSVSYQQLRDEALDTAGRLIARGLLPGDRVVIVADTDPNFQRLLMGCLYARLVPCPAPLPNAFGSKEVYLDQIRRMADIARPRAAITPGLFRDWLIEAMCERDMVFVGAFDDLDNDPGLIRRADAVDIEDLAYLQFSSGTTHAPKGIAVSHRALMANIMTIAHSALELSDEDCGVNWLPFYHDMGLVGSVMTPIASQLTTHYITTRDFIRRPRLWLELISRLRGTISYSPSFGYELTARRVRDVGDLDLSSWRIAGIGGDMIKIANLNRFAEAFAPSGFRATSFLPSYGMAEFTVGITFTAAQKGAQTETVDAEKLEKTGKAVAPKGKNRAITFVSCGKPLPGHKIEIRSNSGAVLQDGQVGTIFAAGPSLMNGYFHDTEQSESVLSDDGWLDTGDLGFMRKGVLTIVGRTKDLIIIKGRNIWPQDIEWSVESLIDNARAGGVSAFALNGVASGTDDERIGLVVECRPRESEAREALRTAARKTVREIYGVEPDVALAAPGTLPRTSSGKLSRAMTRNMFLAGEFEA